MEMAKPGAFHCQKINIIKKMGGGRCSLQLAPKLKEPVTPLGYIQTRMDTVLHTGFYAYLFSFVSLGHPKKNLLFPVQRVSVFEASREAAFFFPLIFFVSEGKYCPFLGKKLFFAKMKKKFPFAPF